MDPALKFFFLHHQASAQMALAFKFIILYFFIHARIKIEVWRIEQHRWSIWVEQAGSKSHVSCQEGIGRGTMKRERKKEKRKKRKKEEENKWIKEKTWGRIEVESSRLPADRASEQTRRFKCIENLRRARNDRNRSRRLHLHSDLDAIRRRDSFVASIVAGRMNLGGIVPSPMERVSLRHFNVGGKCCEGNSELLFFFLFFFFQVKCFTN